MNIGKLIDWWLERRGWRATDLARISQVSPGNISALRRRSSLRSQHVPAIARAFGVTVDDFLAKRDGNVTTPITPRAGPIANALRLLAEQIDQRPENLRGICVLLETIATDRKQRPGAIVALEALLTPPKGNDRVEASYPDVRASVTSARKAPV